MTVLQGSRGSRLAPASKLGVLQLVLGEVVARLPGEKLRELEVCRGLPALDTAGQQLCSLAGASGAAEGPEASGAESSWAHVGSTQGVVQVSTAGHGVQQLQHQLHEQVQVCEWTEGEDDEVAVSDAGEGDEDDDVIATLSTALSSRYYTPRHSLAYESRRASMAAEQAADAQHSGYFDRRPDNSGSNSSSNVSYQQQQQQQQQDKLRSATVAAAAAAAKALLAAVELPRPAAVALAAPVGIAQLAVAPPLAAGLNESSSRQALQPLLEGEPLDCWDEDSACFQSAGSSSCGSSAYLTAASQGAELDQVLAYHSSASADEHGGSAAAVQGATALSTHATPAAGGAVTSTSGDVGSLPVHELLSAAGVPDMSCLTVGEVLQLLTKAVMQQQQQQQHSR
jgi:hypothetical protein